MSPEVTAQLSVEPLSGFPRVITKVTAHSILAFFVGFSWMIVRLFYMKEFCGNIW